MKPGELMDCPHCGENTFLRLESVMDGWTKTGEVLKCSACGAVVGTPETTPAKGKEKAKDNKRSALAALLGGDDTEPVVDAGFFATEKRFCRDCEHRIMTAFRIRCGKTNRDVGPMDDCPEFVRRKSE